MPQKKPSETERFGARPRTMDPRSTGGYRLSNSRSKLWKLDLTKCIEVKCVTHDDLQHRHSDKERRSTRNFEAFSKLKYKQVMHLFPECPIFYFVSSKSIFSFVSFLTMSSISDPGNSNPTFLL